MEVSQKTKTGKTLGWATEVGRTAVGPKTTILSAKSLFHFFWMYGPRLILLLRHEKQKAGQPALLIQGHQPGQPGIFKITSGDLTWQLTILVTCLAKIDTPKNGV